MYVTSKLGDQCREGKPKCVSKAGVDGADVRAVLVGFGKKMVGIGSTDGIGMEMFTERKEEALTKQLARLFGTASEAVDNPGLVWAKLFFQFHYLIGILHCMDE